MEIWAVIAILLLVIGIGAFAGLTYWTEHNNAEKQQNNILYPFTGSVDPKHTGKKVVLTRAPHGRNQIECPVGYHINIVGAFVEVDDPYSECSPSPNATFRATCGDDSSPEVSCTNSGQCGEGMDCVAGKCVPATCSASEDCGASACSVNPGKKCSSHQDCGDPPMVCVGGECQVDLTLGQCTFCRNGRCAQAPTCSNLNDSYQNITCASSNQKNKCRPRDASAYLAKECDGKQSCTVEWDPSSDKFFGPLPCQISVHDPKYATFPIIPGWHGGNPKDAKKSADANFKQGYYVHGVFSCEADSE